MYIHVYRRLCAHLHFRTSNTSPHFTSLTSLHFISPLAQKATLIQDPYSAYIRQCASSSPSSSSSSSFSLPCYSSFLGPFIPSFVPSSYLSFPFPHLYSKSSHRLPKLLFSQHAHATHSDPAPCAFDVTKWPSGPGGFVTLTRKRPAPRNTVANGAPSLSQGDDSSTASFEKTLSNLSTKITDTQALLDRVRSSSRRARVLWTLYLSFAYLVYTIVLLLVIGYKNLGAYEWTGLVGGPVLYDILLPIPSSDLVPPN